MGLTKGIWGNNENIEHSGLFWSFSHFYIFQSDFVLFINIYKARGQKLQLAIL